MKFKSVFSALIDRFIEYRKASGSWNELCYGKNIRYFDHFCAVNFPEDKVLTQSMIDAWCAKRSTEKNSTNLRRTQVVKLFVDYLRHRELTNVLPPPRLKPESYKYTPHFFEEDELIRFFQACDHIYEHSRPEIAIIKLIIPVFFRLLYSTGMRAIEARMLKVNNVNLAHGVIDIQKSKGHDQRYVAMHDTMTSLMVKYDEAIAEYQPSREFFFQNLRGGHYSSNWVQKNFHALWKQANGTIFKVPIANDLRHHYAISNINSWIDDGFAVTDKLLYLSKSMGHQSLQTTTYYYSLVPRLADTLRDKTEAGFNIIVPEATW